MPTYGFASDEITNLMSQLNRVDLTTQKKSSTQKENHAKIWNL